MGTLQNFVSKYDLITVFFNFFENVPFVTLTLTFTFIFIICLGLVSIKDTLFDITILVLFLPSSATFHKKGLN